MKNPITSSSAHNAPVSTESVIPNTGRLNGRDVKILIKSAYETYGKRLIIICVVTAYIAFELAMFTCPQKNQNENEMYCPALSKRSFTCNVARYYSFISIIVSIAITCIPMVMQDIPD